MAYEADELREIGLRPDKVRRIMAEQEIKEAPKYFAAGEKANDSFLEGFLAFRKRYDEDLAKDDGRIHISADPVKAVKKKKKREDAPGYEQLTLDFGV